MHIECGVNHSKIQESGMKPLAQLVLLPDLHTDYTIYKSRNPILISSG